MAENYPPADADGLSTNEAMRRLKCALHSAYPELPLTSSSILQRAEDYGVDYESFIVLAVAVCDVAFEDYSSAWALAAWWLIMRCVKFVYRRKTLATIAAIYLSRRPQATVIRDKVEQKISSSHVVVGDRIVLRPGDIVPADVLLTQVILQPFEVDQSKVLDKGIRCAEKHPGDKVFHPSIVISGEAQAVVLKVGSEMFYGIKENPVSRKIEYITRTHQYVCENNLVFLAALAFLVSALKLHYELNWTQVVPVCLSLGVCSSSSLSLLVSEVQLRQCADRLLADESAVRDLNQVEELARVDTLCLGRDSLFAESQPMLNFSPYRDAPLWELAAVVALPPYKDGAPNAMELGLAEYLTQLNANLSLFVVTHSMKYSEYMKCATATVVTQWDMQTTKYMKGRPEVVLAHCKDEAAEAFYVANMKEFLENRCQALAVAKKVDDTWKFLGLVPYESSPLDAWASVKSEAQQHGVDIKFLSGVSLPELRVLSAKLGFSEGRVRSCSQLQHHYNEGHLLHAQAVADVLLPDDRYYIVHNLESNNRCVLVAACEVSDIVSVQQACVSVVPTNAHEIVKSEASLICKRYTVDSIWKALVDARESHQFAQEAVGYFLLCPMQTLALVLVGAVIGIQNPGVSSWEVLAVSMFRNVTALLLFTGRSNNDSHSMTLQRLLIRNAVMVATSCLASYFYLVHEYYCTTPPDVELNEELELKLCSAEFHLATLLRVALAEVFTLLAVSGLVEWWRLTLAACWGLILPCALAHFSGLSFFTLFEVVAVSAVCFGSQVADGLIVSQRWAQRREKDIARLMHPLLAQPFEDDGAQEKIITHRIQQVAAHLRY